VLLNKLFMNNKREIQWVILYVTALHAIWGAILLIESSAFSTNPIGFFEYFFNKNQTAIAFLLAALSACCSYYKKRFTQFLMLLPQLILLLLASMSGIVSSIRGQYVDGVIRPSMFIFADQLPVILLSLVYGFAIYDKFLKD
jgi:cell division protein FtsW (lipid II flippase)